MSSEKQQGRPPFSCNGKEDALRRPATPRPYNAVPRVGT